MNETHDLHDRVRGTLGTHRGEHYGKGSKGWMRSDGNIRDEIYEALYAHPEIDTSLVEVSVEKGIVYLKGKVRSRGHKKLAESCAESVSGVTDVHNDLTLFT